MNWFIDRKLKLLEPGPESLVSNYVYIKHEYPTDFICFEAFTKPNHIKMLPTVNSYDYKKIKKT